MQGPPRDEGPPRSRAHAKPLLADRRNTAATSRGWFDSFMAYLRRCVALRSKPTTLTTTGPGMPSKLLPPLFDPLCPALVEAQQAVADKEEATAAAA